MPDILRGYLPRPRVFPWARGALLLALSLGLGAGEAYPLGIDFAASPFHEVTFPDIVPTTYLHDAPLTLRCQVAKSASFRVYPFKRVYLVKGLHFDWRFVGEFAVTTKEQEETKMGDDSKLRVGLLILGKPPLLPFLAPAWVKLIGKHMHLPSDRLLNLMPASLHPPGARWESPVAGSQVLNIALPPGVVSAADGWTHVNYELPQAEAVVGLFIGADGDDSASSFESAIKNLVLKEEA